MPKNDRLFEHLNRLSQEDLFHLLLTGMRKKNSPELLGMSKIDIIDMINRELRSAAGNSFLNIRREPYDFPYKQILIDVADKLSFGYSPLSWTKYKLNDNHTEEEIEHEIIRLVEDRARKWWSKLSDKKKKKIIEEINKDLKNNKQFMDALKRKAILSFTLTEQILENIIQTGLVAYLTSSSATGIVGLLGVSLLTQIGWTIMVSIFGYMTAIQFMIFGIGGVGNLGGIASYVGGAAVTAGIAIPGLAIILSNTNYHSCPKTDLD